MTSSTDLREQALKRAIIHLKIDFFLEIISGLKMFLKVSEKQAAANPKASSVKVLKFSKYGKYAFRICD